MPCLKRKRYGYNPISFLSLDEHILQTVNELFVAVPWHSTLQWWFLFVLFYVREHPKAQWQWFCVLKRHSRRTGPRLNLNLQTEGAGIELGDPGYKSSGLSNTPCRFYKCWNNLFVAVPWQYQELSSVVLQYLTVYSVNMTNNLKKSIIQ